MMYMYQENLDATSERANDNWVLLEVGFLVEMLQSLENIQYGKV